MRCLVMMLCVLAATPAFAQPARATYVGASVMGEFARFGGVEFEDDRVGISPTDTSQDGESLGVDLTIGRTLGERWGVELEFARGGVIERRRTVQPLIGLPIEVPPVVPFPDFDYELRTERQFTTISSAAWIRQELGARVDLTFSAGISFSRVEDEQEITNIDTRFAIFLPFPREIEAVQYGVGPVVGAAAVIDLTEHFSLTTGVRLHALGAGGTSGWLLRPAAGGRWRF